MMEFEIAWEFAAALGLGVLIGLERQQKRGESETFAGVRTFSLVSLLGAISVYASEMSGLSWLVVPVFLAVLAVVITAYQVTAKNGDIGATTEVSVLITFFVGCICAWGHVAIAGAISVLCNVVAVTQGLVAQPGQSHRTLGCRSDTQVCHHHADRVAAGAKYKLWPRGARIYQSLQDMVDGGANCRT